MTVADFIYVMDLNPCIYPKYDALGPDQKRMAAHLNICTGTAETFLDDDGRILGVGGIRFVGVGEAWCITLPEKRTPIMLRTVAQNFEQVRDENHLWRVFAESKISENFLKHLKFQKKDGIHIWTRQ